MGDWEDGLERAAEECDSAGCEGVGERIRALVAGGGAGARAGEHHKPGCTQGKADHAPPPRSEDQVRAEERGRVVSWLRRFGSECPVHGDATAHVLALGPAPVDEGGADWPSRDALLAKMDIIALAVGLTIETSFAVILDRVKGQRDRLAAAEDRVRVLEGLLSKLGCEAEWSAESVDPHDWKKGCEVVVSLSRAALAKKEMGT